jgi:hypothetical protein
MNNDLYTLQENWDKLQKNLIEGTNFNNDLNGAVENADQESPDVSLDASIEEADKVVEPKADLSFNISDAWKKANTKDEKTARILIAQLVKEGFREQEAIEKITADIRQLSSVILEKCNASLTIFRKLHKEMAKPLSIDDYLDREK